MNNDNWVYEVELVEAGHHGIWHYACQSVALDIYALMCEYAETTDAVVRFRKRDSFEEEAYVLCEHRNVGNAEND